MSSEQMIIGAPGADSDVHVYGLHVCAILFPPSSAFEGTSIKSAFFIYPCDMYWPYNMLMKQFIYMQMKSI